jgi:isopentenyl diphosphate isomerase/L-lactate dehydrogenase-like FMN-dependent dehydrogenase
VGRALDIIRTELEVSMALTGQRDVRAVGSEVIVQ